MRTSDEMKLKRKPCSIPEVRDSKCNKSTDLPTSTSSSTEFFTKQKPAKTRKPLGPYIIRGMTKKDFSEITQWAIDEGWNPVKEQLKPFFAQDTACYQVLELNGIIIAAILIIKYSNDFAFLGHYIVKEKYRHQGYGKALWDHTLAKCDCVGTIGLNGVKSQINNYIESGFTPTFMSSCWKGNINMAKTNQYSLRSRDHLDITKLAAQHKIMQYDKTVVPYQRTQFLHEWLKMPGSCTLTAIKENNIVGYCVISPCHKGYKIAPLYANDKDIAKKIIEELATQFSNELFYIDTPGNNPHAALLAQSLGLKKEFDVQRMFTHGEPIQPIDFLKIFGFNTLEFGV